MQPKYLVPRSKIVHPAARASRSSHRGTPPASPVFLGAFGLPRGSRSGLPGLLNSLLQLLLVVTALVSVGGCKSGSAPRSNKTTSAPAVTAPKLAETAPAREPEPKAPAAAPAPDHKEGVEWTGNVTWRSWEEAVPLAKRESKPILVLVYADWCPHCRTLAPAFGDPQVEALAKHFVMVRQNHDDDPAWLEPYKKHGSYVPRVFFFDSKGQMRDDITSGHPRFPFFYAAEHIDFLKQSMRRVMGS